MSDEPMIGQWKMDSLLSLLKTSQLTLALDFDPRKDKIYITQTKRFVFLFTKLRLSQHLAHVGVGVYLAFQFGTKKKKISSKPSSPGVQSPVSWDYIDVTPGNNTNQASCFHFHFENQQHLFLECLLT